jgi:hypothetical protein
MLFQFYHFCYGIFQFFSVLDNPVAIVPPIPGTHWQPDYPLFVLKIKNA